jgi:poly(glycerol-phosphate) alpha-glucosyltransferase
MLSSQHRLSVLTNSISRVNGGIFDAMRNLTMSIAAEKRYLPVVFSARDTYTASDAVLWNNIATNAFQVRGPHIFGYAPGLATALEVSDAEILHVHGIWMYPSVAALRWSHGKRPYLVSPHGLLRPWALRNSRWKKRIAAMLYENMHLRRAACLHALTAAEAESFREYGLKNPICLIPNGTNLRLNRVGSEPRQGRSILYLGRFHPSKGLRSLIEAWRAVCEEAEAAGWRLKLAGWDQNNHRAELEQLADQLRIRSSITFLGPQFDADKERCLAAASAFILPSKSEGLPVSILEAWSWQIPVLMTHECNLPEGVEARAAITMDPEADSIAAALRRLFSLTDEEREAMGLNGRNLVEKRFQWQRIGETMTEVYDWILGCGPRPECVTV